MDDFFDKLFQKIAEFHEREIHMSQSLAEYDEDIPMYVLEKARQDFHLKEYLWFNRDKIPSA